MANATLTLSQQSNASPSESKGDAGKTGKEGVKGDLALLAGDIAAQEELLASLAGVAVGMPACAVITGLAPEHRQEVVQEATEYNLAAHSLTMLIAAREELIKEGYLNVPSKRGAYVDATREEIVDKRFIQALFRFQRDKSPPAKPEAAAAPEPVAGAEAAKLPGSDVPGTTGAATKAADTSGTTTKASPHPDGKIGYGTMDLLKGVEGTKYTATSGTHPQKVKGADGKEVDRTIVPKGASDEQIYDYFREVILENQGVFHDKPGFVNLVGLRGAKFVEKKAPAPKKGEPAKNAGAAAGADGKGPAAGAPVKGASPAVTEQAEAPTPAPEVALEHVENKYNEWNDTMMVLMIDTQGNKVVKKWSATVDNSADEKSKELSTLPEGTHAYEKGDHKGYDALVPANPDRLTPSIRDGQAYHGKDQPGVHGGQSINIHKTHGILACHKTGVPKPNKYSKGCTVINGENNFDELMELVDGACKSEKEQGPGQTEIMYTVLSASRLAGFQVTTQEKSTAPAPAPAPEAKQAPAP